MSHLGRSWYRARVGGLIDTYLAGSAAQEQLAVDLDAPVAAQWVELKRAIIEIAGDLGIGDEVAAVFEVLKANYTAQVVTTAAGTAGGTLALGAVGGVAAGVIGAVVVVGLGIFGGDDGPTEAKLRRDAIRASLWKALATPSFSSLAGEQDAQSERAAKIAKSLAAFQLDAAPFQKLSVTAAKLAKFYRLVEQTLSPSEEKLFLAFTFLSRLSALQNYLAGLDTSAGSGYAIYSEKSEIYIAFPDIDEQLAATLAVAKKMVAAAPKVTKPKQPGMGLLSGGTLVALAVGAGSLAYFKPELARKILSTGTSAVKTGAGAAVSAGRAVMSTASKVGS